MIINKVIRSEDQILVERFRSGDGSAFDIIYHRYKERIFNYLCRMTDNRSLAEEVTQETFIKVYLNIGQYRPLGSFSSWVYSIARNLAKNEFRRLGREKKVSMETVIATNGNTVLKDMIESRDPGPEEIIDSKYASDKLAEFLKKMPPKFREVIILCALQGESYENAARIIGCSKEVIAIRLFRARKRLAEMLKTLKQA